MIGNNPTATPSSGTDVDITGPLREASALDESGVDRYLRDEAVEWVTGHPGDAFWLFLGKTLNYFAPYNSPVSDIAGADVQKVVAYVAFAGVVALVLLRIAWRHRLMLDKTEWVFLGIFLVNAPVMAIFFTRTRFRQPLDAILVVEAAVALVIAVYLFTERRRGRRKRTIDGTSCDDQ